MNKKLLQWLIDHAKETEWTTVHAAENRICSYCCKDTWKDQKEHEPDCQYVKMMTEILKESP